jgi:hypothetical protein
MIVAGAEGEITEILTGLWRCYAERGIRVKKANMFRKFGEVIF